MAKITITIEDNEEHLFDQKVPPVKIEFDDDPPLQGEPEDWTGAQRVAQVIAEFLITVWRNAEIVEKP